MTYRRAVKTKSGAPVDADFQAAATDGLLAVDTTAKLLYYRAGGTWGDFVDWLRPGRT